MSNPAMEEFAKAFVRYVRDPAIRSCDILLRPESRIAAAIRWRKSGVSSEALAAIVPEIIDEALFYVLDAIDQGALHLTFKADDGTEMDLTEGGLGELAGWYGGIGGWRAMYSEERFIDEQADLDRFPRR